MKKLPTVWSGVICLIDRWNHIAGFSVLEDVDAVLEPLDIGAFPSDGAVQDEVVAHLLCVEVGEFLEVHVERIPATY